MGRGRGNCESLRYRDGICFGDKFNIISEVHTLLRFHLHGPYSVRTKRKTFMPEAKRRRLDSAVEQNTMEPVSAPSPFLPTFESFRNELDEHHDRRERIVKASHDITALSKKM